MPAERQRQILFGLLALLAVVGTWQYLGATASPEGGAPAAAARRAAVTSAPPVPVDVTLESLGDARHGPDDAGRNLFVFGARQVVAPAGGVTRRPVRPNDGAIAPPVFTPTGPPPPPPIPLKFIGLVEGTATSRRIAVLSDTKGLVVHGTEGAIIDGRYRILAIGPESIDIAYADGRGRQTLRLSGQ
ncbi:MAG: hypothetical protein U0P30_07430 [Vicinamibacterales bacterium]